MSQIEVILFLNFQTGCILFLSLSLSLYVAGEAILVLFLIFGGKHSTLTIKYDVSCGILIDALYQLEEAVFYS